MVRKNVIFFDSITINHELEIRPSEWDCVTPVDHTVERFHVDGGSNTRPFTFNPAAPNLVVTLLGATIWNGYADPKGGSLLVLSGVGHVEHTEMIGGRVAGGSNNVGGNVAVDPGASLEFRHVELLDGTAEHGGGNLFASQTSSILLEECLIDGGVVTDPDGMGGGLFLDESPADLIRTTVSNNFTPLSGGGIAARNGGYLALTDSFVQDNEATGGGIFGGGTGVPGGGGVFIGGQALILGRNTRIRRNVSDTGGGVQFQQILPYNISVVNPIPSLRAPKISHNVAILGGGVAVSTASPFPLTVSMVGGWVHDNDATAGG